ncbi:protein of unknown function [uncultured Sphingopyxis sp.]|uniref:Uncharacterized protein n=1 Tax=uncultured Sphingopyxis sp. TaxID=310581 RepID=A0A1Y5PW44_9SPHN|nr:protein of unknown function [uncultured Sphingopyxis sp.]
MAPARARRPTRSRIRPKPRPTRSTIRPTRCPKAPRRKPWKIRRTPSKPRARKRLMRWTIMAKSLRRRPARPPRPRRRPIPPRNKANQTRAAFPKGQGEGRRSIPAPFVLPAEFFAQPVTGITSAFPHQG